MIDDAKPPVGGAGLGPAGADVTAVNGEVWRRGFTGEPGVHPCSILRAVEGRPLYTIDKELD